MTRYGRLHSKWPRRKEAAAASATPLDEAGRMEEGAELAQRPGTPILADSFPAHPGLPAALRGLMSGMKSLVESLDEVTRSVESQAAAPNHTICTSSRP